MAPSAREIEVYPCPPAEVVIVKFGSVAVADRVNAIFLLSVVTIVFPLSYAACKLLFAVKSHFTTLFDPSTHNVG